MATFGDLERMTKWAGRLTVVTAPLSPASILLVPADPDRVAIMISHLGTSRVTIGTGAVVVDGGGLLMPTLFELPLQRWGKVVQGSWRVTSSAVAGAKVAALEVFAREVV